MTRLSLMPTNLHEQLTPVKFRDRIEFLVNQKGDGAKEESTTGKLRHKQN